MLRRPVGKIVTASVELGRIPLVLVDEPGKPLPGSLNILAGPGIRDLLNGPITCVGGGCAGESPVRRRFRV